jgi:hypothetical protein
MPSPIVGYVDAVVGTNPTRRSAPQKKGEIMGRVIVPSNNGVLQSSGVMGIHLTPVQLGVTPSGGGTLNLNHVGPSFLFKRKKRSPSFSNASLVIQGSPLSVVNTGAVPPDATSAASPNHVLTTINTATGSLVIVTDKNTGYLGSFYINSIAVSTGCNGTTNGNGQVAWDSEASLWILAERGTDLLCVYISETSDPFANYTSFAYGLPSGSTYPVVGIWKNAYLLTFSTLSSAYNMCVLDRTQMISFVDGPNATAPVLFCGAPYNGRLAGFPNFQSWTPISVQGVMPPRATEAAGSDTTGAVFFRHIDDELHSGANTPAFDTIEVEHWYNINFTTYTYNAVRYMVSVADFNSANGTCTSPSACVPTPTAQHLDPVREVVMPRASYTYIPATGQQSVVFSLTSHSNGTAIARVNWYELRWLSPVLFTPPLWTKYQEGTLPFNDTIHRWLGSAAMDGNGTIALVYAASSSSVYPSLYVTSRLANDPPGVMRDPLLLYSGNMGSTLSNNRWGKYFSVSVDPSHSRTFYVTGMSSSNTYPWTAHLVKVRVLGETIQRTWKASDYCSNPSATCVQTITTI